MCRLEYCLETFEDSLFINKGSKSSRIRQAIFEAKLPSNKTELQRFLCQVNFLRRFNSNLVGKVMAFTPLLQLKKHDEFIWKNDIILLTR